MLHAAFKISSACLISALRVFFNTFVLVGINIIAWSGSQTACQIYTSLSFWQLLECPRQWTSTLQTLPLAYLQSVQRTIGSSSSNALQKQFLIVSADYPIPGTCKAPDVSLQVEREILRTSIVNAG
ncbi:hypothetical protein AVEN_22019-1 [Araneus ventricosus]|uniref:Uncharacterized protein n=1 Tax=Araneus ventricosus TaxID=182803 RepID=A0A4Y2HS07_ARAVE|nr:hypothetical protein AVEN_22019-1 [Araneus ventricosus]